MPAHSPLMKTKKLRVQYRPYPVVGVISPWNFPLILSLGDAIPALQAGAAVVIKPSEVTPLGHRRDRRGLEARDRRPRRARRRQRRRRDGLGAGGRGRLRPVHGLRPHREEGAGAGRRDADPGQRRAGRQGPDDRAEERRHREGRQRGHLGLLPEHRPGLHVGRAALRGGAGLRRVRAPVHRRGEVAEAGHGRPRVRPGRRRDDLPAPDRDRRGPRRRRPRAAARRSSPAASASTGRATGTRRR